MKEKDRSCPRKRFREDLVRQLKNWRGSGERLVVCLDANEDIYSKSIGKALTDPDGLGMVEVVGEFTGKKVGATFYRGKKPIDGVWATPDILWSPTPKPAGITHAPTTWMSGVARIPSIGFFP